MCSRDRGSFAHYRHPYSRPNRLTDRDRDRVHRADRREPQHDHQPPHVQAAQVHEGNQSQCQICSHTQPYPSQQYPVYHQHYSSLRLRGLLNVEASGAEYLCPSCMSRHKPYQNSSDDRVKVIVSDILHQYFSAPGHSGDKFHVDYVTIKGG